MTAAGVGLGDGVGVGVGVFDGVGFGVGFFDFTGAPDSVGKAVTVGVTVGVLFEHATRTVRRAIPARRRGTI